MEAETDRQSERQRETRTESHSERERERGREREPTRPLARLPKWPLPSTDAANYAQN